MLRLVLFLLLGLSVCVYPQTAEELQKTAQEQKRTGRVFLNFQDADISLVVKFMSELTGKNIVLDPAVRGTITVSSAKPVSVQTAWEIFILALSLQGYGVVEEKNYVKIVPLQKATSLAELKKPSHSGEVIVYIYKAENTQALQLQQAVQPFLSPNAKITVHVPSNSLIIADVAKYIERLKKILKELDSPERGLSVKLYKLQKANAESVFQSLQALGSAFQQQFGTPIFITFSKDSNSILVIANEKVQDLIKEVIETLDEESLGPLERNFYLIKLNHVSAEELYRSLQTLFGGGLPTTQVVQPQERRVTPPDTRGIEIPLQREERRTAQRQTTPLTAVETKEGLKENAIEHKLFTDDGSEGQRGSVLQALKDFDESWVVHACGPKKMLKVLKEMAEGREVYLSLEADMACGWGVCLGCVVPSKDGKFLRVCYEGPVFPAEEVVL